jgi:hypothetical protein
MSNSHNAWLFGSIALFVAMGAPLGAIVKTRTSSYMLGAPTSDEERQRRAALYARIRPRAYIALAIMAAMFATTVCITFATG